MHLLYNLLALVLVVLAAPVFLYRLIREAGFGERLKQSFGWLPSETVAKVANKNAIWLHAASVGEIVATSPMVKEIKKEMPDNVVVISVVTASGYDMAKRIIPEADGVIFFPLDLPWLSCHVVKKIAPQAFLLVETELWPNFLKASRKAGIPVMMVNGRIGDKSFGNYRYLGSVLQDMLQTVVKFCMQSSIDAQYIIKLGADPQRVMVTGNTKYDQTYTDVSEGEQKLLISQYGFAGQGPIIIAGSTHKGEEESLFTSFGKIRNRFPQACLVIAPRDIQRADELVSMAAASGHRAVKRSKLEKENAGGHNTVILDTIGELGRVYSIADVVFVGGSLIPQGGHNILEPAAHGKPIVVGPHMFNFKDIYALLSDRKACITAKDPALLTDKLLAVLENKELSETMSKNARAIIEENRGAAHKNTLQLKQLLEKANNL
ncbi:3-deoxy-D-manno-octulosonic-acid transferase [Anaerospora hongkongensis]|uniref:3-deoxy-D-manno-octulosonic acid transferase n=1 Tax=Anaerospora hongkongensis TaxID=244830 RepID=A0A4R1PSN5_9FIRM|nr:3-deoxy-D-manno-octulosonic acid transferase [Anaerospora hongkongensis]TCL32938.1 3-deoxy-D-manno-octulosonic-acid transferase [Anaerospora hongkongensis]